MHLLAILGQPSELDRIVTVGRAIELGPTRFTALAAFGHPAVIEEILSGIENNDPAVAVAAGLAFAKMTGADIDSDDTASLAEEESDAEPSGQDFPEGSSLPDPKLAREHWNQVHGQFAQGTRWCRGFDLSREVTAQIVDQLDLESRWETCLRASYQGIWQMSPIDLERCPALLPSPLASPKV